MVPKFTEFMYSALECLKDGQVQNNAYIYEWLKNHHGMSDEDMNERVEGSQTLRAKNNMSWALVYLCKAGLLGREKRGFYKITELGLKEYAENQNHHIDTKYLLAKYNLTNNFFTGRKSEGDENNEPVKTAVTEETPYETAVNAIGVLNDSVAFELLEKVRQMNPQKFEQLVVDLLVRMGYGGSVEDAGSVTQYTQDEGIDGIIKEDCLGLDMIYLQAKRWCQGNNVGRREIQAFVGALFGQKAGKGVFITTSAFTKEAVEYAKNVGVKIVLIDGMKLCAYMMKYDLGVTTKEVFAIKKIDSDYFEEE